jgi:hypothetical protein
MASAFGDESKRCRREGEIMVTAAMSVRTGELDPEKPNSTAHDFEERLERKVVGQDEAVQVTVERVFYAHLSSSGRPVGSLFFLGPTGTGKTHGHAYHFERNFANCRKLSSHRLIKFLIFRSLRVGIRVLLTDHPAITEGVRMLKIQRKVNGKVIFTLSGRIEAEDIGELRRLFNLEAAGCHIALDLKDVTLVDRDGVKFLAACEADSIELENCPPYVREWIGRESGQKRRQKQ